MLKTAPLGIAIIKSVSGRIIHVNDACCHLLGRTAQQVLGQTWMHFTHLDDVARDHYAIYQMFETKKPQILITKRYVRPNGDIVHAQVTITPFNDGGKEPTHIVMIQDITEQLRMQDELKLRSEQLRESREEVLNALVVVSRFRDRETGDHLWRTRAYMRVILESLNTSQTFSRQGIETIASASVLHDIGKIGIPDAILLKKGKLDPDEMAVMKTHTTLGSNAILETMRHIKGNGSLIYAREIAEFHHERWDGEGYPHGLKGTTIPLTARVMAVVDAYDALRSVRPYKDAFSHEVALRTIESESGSHFDPDIVAVFFEKESLINEISKMKDIASCA
ncbi:MAG TPA: PAS domain S-box protein [Treponemataceae bacterium]|nr:PAS domain S-box protein [Treponemataceae bacterium]HPS44364.1 PAS domain S-box protein [Treponemataceae bacterium]